MSVQRHTTPTCPVSCWDWLKSRRLQMMSANEIDLIKTHHPQILTWPRLTLTHIQYGTWHKVHNVIGLPRGWAFRGHPINPGQSNLMKHMPDNQGLCFPSLSSPERPWLVVTCPFAMVTLDRSIHHGYIECWLLMLLTCYSGKPIVHWPIRSLQP